MNDVRTRLLCAVTMLVLGTGTGTVWAAKKEAAVVAPDSGATYVAPRASWLGDTLPLVPGDLLTVVVDEQTLARESVGRTARSDHGLDAELNPSVAEDARLGPIKGFQSSLRTNSRDDGVANRQGTLTAIITVRVLWVSPRGVAHVQGTRSVTVDGRPQVATLTGWVRAQDVRPGNLVESGRVADALITLDGKKIGPSIGIVGKLLAMLWP